MATVTVAESPVRVTALISGARGRCSGGRRFEGGGGRGASGFLKGGCARWGGGFREGGLIEGKLSGDGDFLLGLLPGGGREFLHSQRCPCQAGAKADSRLASGRQLHLPEIMPPSCVLWHRSRRLLPPELLLPLGVEADNSDAVRLPAGHARQRPAVRSKCERDRRPPSSRECNDSIARGHFSADLWHGKGNREAPGAILVYPVAQRRSPVARQGAGVSEYRGRKPGP